MSEHRTPEVKTIISELEKKIKEEERKAYVDPEKAEEAKEKGNDFFNKGNFLNVCSIMKKKMNMMPYSIHTIQWVLLKNCIKVQIYRNLVIL